MQLSIGTTDGVVDDIVGDIFEIEVDTIKASPDCVFNLEIDMIGVIGIVVVVCVSHVLIV